MIEDRICANCAGIIPKNKRSDSIVCSDACKSAMKRAKRKAVKQPLNYHISGLKIEQFTMPEITSSKTCAAPKCLEMARLNSIFCCNNCRVAYQRTKSPEKEIARNKRRNTSFISEIVNLTNISKELPKDELIEMIRRVLKIAAMNNNDPKLKNSQLRFIRRMLRSPYLVKGDNKDKTLAKKHGVIFPYIVADYVNYTFHCSILEYINSPNQPPICSSEGWIVPTKVKIEMVNPYIDDGDDFIFDDEPEAVESMPEAPSDEDEEQPTPEGNNKPSWMNWDDDYEEKDIMELGDNPHLRPYEEEDDDDDDEPTPTKPRTIEEEMFDEDI